MLDVVFEICFHVGKFLQRLAVIVGKLADGRHNTLVVLVCQYESTVYEVAEDCHQLVVVARLEILPSEVVVLCFRRVGCQHIAQHVLLAGHVAQIFVQPHRPVA